MPSIYLKICLLTADLFLDRIDQQIHKILPMPTISIFYGIIIQMFWKDHAPPHFHARYQKYKVQIDIQTLEIIKGKMPNRALSLILEWATKNRNQLLEDWELCQKNQTPRKIPPLK